jgi:hypothetical protein
VDLACSDPATDLFQAWNLLSPFASAGTYHVTEVQLQDKAGNLHDYRAADLAALGLNTAFTFTGAAADTTAPTLVSDNPLTVVIGATATITSSLLAVTDSDNSNAQLTYTVVTGPSDGNLLRNGSPTSSFTQADIDNGLITYHETANKVSSDFFTFFVSDPTGNKTATLPFQIQIASPTGPNPSPPAGTSADMILRRTDGTYAR